MPERPTRLEQAAFAAVKREIAASPEQFFKQRLELIEASLEELLTEVSAHHTDLTAKIETVSGATTRQTDLMAAKIVVIQKAVQELQILVYGEPRYQLAGLAAEVKATRLVIDTMRTERQGLHGLVKLMLALIIIGLAAGVALVIIAIELLSK